MSVSRLNTRTAPRPLVKPMRRDLKKSLRAPKR
jgi:hypothetical protein